MNPPNLKALAEQIAIPVRHLRYLMEQIELYIPKAIVWAFGSRVKWSHRPESDLDLAVLCDKETAKKGIPKLNDALQESDLPFKVQLLDFNRLPENMQENIKKNYIVLYQPKEKILPNNWKETTLGDVAGVQTGPFGSQLHEKDYVADGTPIITVENLVNDYINHSHTTPRVSDADKARLARYTLKEGDIVFSRVGSVDRCGYVSAKEDGWLFSGRLLRVRPSKSVFNKFVFYWMSQYRTKEYVRKIAVGATMPSINTELLSQVPIAYPFLSEQKAIAAILSSFDNKIELLRRQNKTLEQIAQTIFKEWFVNFTVNGKKLKACGEPAESMNSKTGLPEGWRMGKLGKVACISIGRTPPRKEAEWFSFNPKNNWKWVSIKDLGNAGVYIGQTSEFLTQEAVSTFNIPIIPKNTVVVSFKLTVGRIAITTEDMLSNEAIAHVKLQDRELTAEYVYLYLMNYNFDFLGSTSSIATAINSQSVKEIEIAVPDRTTSQDCDRLIAPVFRKIRSNFYQIQTLSRLRDALLPKLMKGEIRVKDADSLVKEKIK